MIRLQVIGGGRMGEALLGGLLASGWAEPHEIAVVERLAPRRSELGSRFEGVSILSEPEGCEGAVIAVKPADAQRACAELADVGVERVLSIAAGVTTVSLEAALGAAVPVVRAMPNTPALVGGGVAAIAAGTHAGAGDLAWASEVLVAVGTVVEVPESLLDAVTGLSGSGPAYLFYVAEALLDAGVQEGLPLEVARALAYGTILGAGRMLTETGETPEALRAAVTSPGGTTEAGIAVLEAAGVREALVAAVAAATARSRELGAT